jgi:CBS domain containing-hemolysin-like protein
MGQADGPLNPGDVIEYGGLRFTIEEMEGKRVSRLRMQVAPAEPPRNHERNGGPRR